MQHYRTLWKRFVATPLAQTVAEASWFGFLLTAVLIAAVVNLGTGVVMELAGPGWAAITLVLLLAATLVFANLYAASVKRGIEQGHRVIANRSSPPARRGLVVMVSGGPTAAQAVKHHAERLEHLWMIVTPEMCGQADELKAFAEGNGVRCWHLDLADEYDADGCYRLVRDVFEVHAARVGVDRRDLIADMTGGTKPMSAAMVLACADLGDAALEHVPTEFVGTDATYPFRPIEVVIHSRAPGTPDTPAQRRQRS